MNDQRLDLVETGLSRLFDRGCAFSTTKATAEVDESSAVFDITVEGFNGASPPGRCGLTNRIVIRNADFGCS